MAKAKATAPAAGVWAMGARTVRQAEAETGLSRQELWELMREGVVPWFSHGGNGRRLMAWGALVAYLERLHAAHTEGDE